MDNTLTSLLSNPPASLERITVILEYQARAMDQLTEKVDKLTELSSAVHSLTDKISSVEGQHRRVGDIKAKQDTHQTLLNITGLIFLTFIPIMVTWNYQLREELQVMHSSSDASNERIKNLERIIYGAPAQSKGN